MGLIESLAYAAGTVSYKIKSALGIEIKTPEHLKFKQDPHAPRNQWGEIIIPGYSEQQYPPGERNLATIPSQMNSVKAPYDKEVRKIFTEIRDLTKKIEKAKTDDQKQSYQAEIDKLNTRFDEIKAEVKVKIDKIRTKYKLAPDDDQSHPNWGYKV